MPDASKVAVVTGAAHGIGHAIAERMAQSSWRVVLADIDEEAAREAADALQQSGATTLPHQVDGPFWR
jgi:3-oxoacyl-[acyl-carrier protein] reductase